MKRENLYRAQTIVNRLEYLEKVRDKIHFAHQKKFYGYTGVSIKIDDDLEYTFPDNVEFSMFYNILKSSVEDEIENYNKQLEEL
jgi:hypothetical protein